MLAKTAAAAERTAAYLLKKLFSRTAITAVIIVAQIVWFLVILLRLGDAVPILNYILRFLSLIAILHVIKNDMDPSYKVSWVLFIALLPLFGGLMYVLFGNKRPAKRLRRKLNVQLEETARYYALRPSVADEIDDDGVRGLFKYLEKYSGYRACRDTHTEYFPVGEDLFASLLPELEKAESFIFIEYFIINKGQMWDAMLDVLRRKVEQGVEVRIIYDDVGCADYLPAGYFQTLRGYGIKAMAFNKFIPIVSAVMNNRDHRKITVIDGKVGFIGGINISDEYINKKERFGHWKDTGLMFKGTGVENLTVMFLEMWNAFEEKELGYSAFVPEEYSEHGAADDGYVLSFSDNPLDDENVSENVYSDIIHGANDYVYITTPYLAIDSSMQNALCLAAKRGVDVRLITPGIPDKKMVYRLTRSYYASLIRAGVKIYEYTPGFVHAKSYVADDKLGVVGTINMDYRSLYLHFECGTLMYNSPAVIDLKNDDLATIEKCRKIELSDCRTSFFGELIDRILRVLAPLL